MRVHHGLLIASIAFNCVAIVFMVRPMITASDVEPSVIGASKRPLDRFAPQGGMVAAEPGDSEGLWNRLYSDDLQVMIDRMRIAGIPESELRVAIGVVFAQKVSVRRAALVREREPWPYWRKVGNEEAERELDRELQRQMAPDQKIINAVSGIRSDDLGRLMDQAVDSVGPVDHLPAEKREIFRRITQDYKEIQRSLWAMGGSSVPAVDEKIRQLEVEYERDLRAALTPEEYEEHHLKAGPTARLLRERLEHFQPTEDEYKAIHAAHESVRMSLLGAPPGEATERARAQAIERLRPQIEEALGAERYVDYEQALSPTARMMNEFLAWLDLPLGAGRVVEETRRDILQRAESVRADSSLPPTERDARLAALKQEARARVSAALGGDRNLGAYEEMERWIRDLRPAP
jgi:hypothetical protein